MRLSPWFLFLVLLFGACGTGNPSAEAQNDLLVDAEWLAEHLDDEAMVVLHVGRDSTDYNAGHIPGARFLPLSAIAVNRDSMLNVLPPAEEVEASFERVGVSDDSRVILYGDLRGLAAARAFFALEVLGHEQVALLDGGLDAWTRAGRTPSQDAVLPAEGALNAQVRERLVVDASSVNERRDEARTILIDARPPDQHTGVDPGAGIVRPGHIPASVNLFWEEDLQADGTLRPMTELASRYGEAGVSSEREVITYCRTGMQASFAYFVTRYLGLQPRMYDGSFHDWSNNTDYPVETSL